MKGKSSINLTSLVEFEQHSMADTIRNENEEKKIKVKAPVTAKKNKQHHSNKISTVQFGIQLCHTDPRLSCSFSTLNPRADIDRWDFHSVRLFTVEIWLE